MSRFEHKPTDENRAKIGALASYGVKDHEIAKYVGIGVETLYKYYSEDMRVAHIERNGEVAKFLHHAATGRAIEDGASYSDCLRVAMFWAKTRMQWAETNNTDTTSTTGPSRVVAMNAKSKQNPKR